MIAHSSKLLDERMIRKEVIYASAKKLITTSELESVMNAHLVKLYSPNLFIRIGIFILTCIIVSMGFGLFVMLFNSSNSETEFSVICLLFAIALYVALEYVLRTKHHYHSGLDDALLWMSAAFFIVSVYLLFSSIPAMLQALLFLMVASLGMIRFLSPVMSGIAFLSLLALIYFILSPFGKVAQASLPFVLMIVSLLTYLVVRRKRKLWPLRHYNSCLVVIEVLSLICTYASVNYFVVRETSIELLGLHLPGNASLPGGWLFWITTFGIPVACLIIALRVKDRLLLRIGLLLSIATIVTVRYYYAATPLEVLTTIGGALLVLCMYAVIRYFDKTRHGISSKDNDDPNVPGFLQVESLIVAETFHQVPVPDANDGFRFGGGSSGGAGATGEY